MNNTRLRVTVTKGGAPAPSAKADGRTDIVMKTPQQREFGASLGRVKGRGSGATKEHPREETHRNSGLLQELQSWKCFVSNLIGLFSLSFAGVCPQDFLIT